MNDDRHTPDQAGGAIGTASAAGTPGVEQTDQPRRARRARFASKITGRAPAAPIEAEQLERAAAVGAVAAAEFLQRFFTRPPRVEVVPSDDFTVQQYSIGSTVPVMIAPRLGNRLRVSIANRHGSGNLWLAPSREECTSTAGFKLAAAETITLDTRAALWAISSVSNGVTVEILAEFSEAER